MLSKLVRDMAKDTSSVTVEEVENHYPLLKVGPAGKHAGVQNVPQHLVHMMLQQDFWRQTGYAWPTWNGSPTVSALLQPRGRGGYRDFHPHQHISLVTATTGYLVKAYWMPSLTKKQIPATN